MPRLNRPLRRSAPWTRLAAAAALGASLAACADRVVTTGSIYPADVRERHPIVLTDAPRTLDVFVNGASGLDPRQRSEVWAFAQEYRHYGQGPLVALAPTGAPNAFGAQRTLEAIQGVLAEAGLPGAAVSAYQVSDPRTAAPVRLSFQRLQAKVASRCGQWPQDLGVSDVGFNLRNEPYWNLGCAVRANTVAQVADPVDLVRGRPPSPPDTGRRMRVFQAIREGQDPSTQYRREAVRIGQ